jgi:hypothetical protein
VSKTHPIELLGESQTLILMSGTLCMSSQPHDLVGRDRESSHFLYVGYDSELAAACALDVGPGHIRLP